VTIEPDTKNWTWVLERPCPDCAFDATTIVPRHIGAIIRDLASQWEAVLMHPQVTARPSPNVWSPLEYGCHVRDVFRLFLLRLDLMLTHDAPTFDNWDQDATAVADRYDLQDPNIVRREIVIAADELADRFDAVTAGEWSRLGMRSDGAAFSIESFGKYLLHDPIHHLWDVAHPGAHMGS
jgi:hypothetical protein